MPGYDLSIRELPVALLQAELQRRQDGTDIPKCGSKERGAYNTTAHVFALILILILSLAACGAPLISKQASKTAGPNRFIFYSQHFGTGVLIATAFVHLLPTAFTSLTDPCLTGVWKSYKPMAGLIAMISALSVVGIEMFLRTRGAHHKHSHGETWDAVATEEDTTAENANGSGGIIRHGRQAKHHRPADLKIQDGDTAGLIDNVSPFRDSTPSTNSHPTYHHTKNEDTSDPESDIDLEDLDLEELDPNTTQNHAHLSTAQSQTFVQHGKEEQKKKLLQCLLLEAGILFHSVFIGMAISVATGTPFLVFLTAIAFHQSFEGIALGTRIAALAFPRSSPRPWLMVLAYGTTTPIGQAIGLGVHKLYDPQSEAGLLMVGVMNGVSSGLLLFAGLVQLLAEDFLSDSSYESLRGKKRWEAYGCVVAGAFLMALVGAWA